MMKYCSWKSLVKMEEDSIWHCKPN